MYLFYFDESGNPKVNKKSVTAQPWFALGAVGIHSSQWWAINSTLTTLKMRYFPGVPANEIEIKSSALRSWGTPRAKWPWILLNDSQAQSFVEELYAIYAAYDLPLFAVGLDKAAQLQIAPNNPPPLYEVALTALLQSINRFLTKHNKVGLCFLDEYTGVDKVVISWYNRQRRAGGDGARAIARIIEPPAFVVSSDSQMISLADVIIYNVYRQFRYNDPIYPYFARIRPQLIELIRLPKKEPPKIGSSR